MSKNDKIASKNVRQEYHQEEDLQDVFDLFLSLLIQQRVVSNVKFYRVEHRWKMSESYE